MTFPFPKLCRRCVPLIMLPLMVSGCTREFYRSGASILWPAGTHDATLADTAESAGEDAAAPQPIPPTRQPIIAPQSPEAFMPAPSALPKEPGKPQNDAATSPRHLAGAGLPDFSYAEAFLVEDVAWHGEVLVTGVVTVAPQATLTIAPGTVVRFGGTTDSIAAKPLLLVQGRVVATGTKEQPVLFTSRFAEPGKGDWQGILILGSEKKNVLEHCLLEGAETGIDASFSTIALKNVLVTRSGTGLRLHDTVVSLRSGGAMAVRPGLS